MIRPPHCQFPGEIGHPEGRIHLIRRVGFESLGGAEPLGPLLYFLYLDGMRGRVAAIGLVISVISIILIAIAQRYSRWDTK